MLADSSPGCRCQLSHHGLAAALESRTSCFAPGSSAGSRMGDEARTAILALWARQPWGPTDSPTSTVFFFPNRTSMHCHTGMEREAVTWGRHTQRGAQWLGGAGLGRGADGPTSMMSTRCWNLPAIPPACVQ